MNRDQRHAARELVAELSHLLHEADPDGMGASVGAPSDEYDHLVPTVLHALEGSEETNAGGRLRKVIPSASDDPATVLWVRVRNWELDRGSPDIEHRA